MARKPQKPVRTGSPLHVWLPKPLLAAFEELLKRTRRSKTVEVQVMMEEYLTKAGLWHGHSGISEKR
jgi:hypothetical protein